MKQLVIQELNILIRKTVKYLKKAKFYSTKQNIEFIRAQKNMSVEGYLDVVKMY